MKPNVGLIAGVIVGTFVLIMLLIGGFLYWRQRQDEAEDESDKYSVAAPSYIERIKGVLTRSDSRASGRTAVDPENGSVYRTDADKEAGYGSKWWKNIKEMVTGHQEPTSPTLPVQHQRPNGGVGDVPEPNAANVWMNGSRQIDQNRRFSNQSLEQAWDNRGSGQPYGQQGGNSRQGHSRNRSSPTVSTHLVSYPSKV